MLIHWVSSMHSCRDVGSMERFGDAMSSQNTDVEPGLHSLSSFLHFIVLLYQSSLDLGRATLLDERNQRKATSVEPKNTREWA